MPKPMLYCSFCGKSQNEVRKLIAGANVFICDECVSLCTSIINEQGRWRLWWRSLRRRRTPSRGDLPTPNLVWDQKKNLLPTE